MDDSSLIYITASEDSYPLRTTYNIELSRLSDIKSQNTSIAFKSTVTGQVEKLDVQVLIEEPKTGSNVIPPSMCPTPSPAQAPSGGLGWRRLFLSILGETSSWFIGYSIMIATIILILILYHKFAQRRGPPYPYPYDPMHGTPPPYYTPYTYRSPGTPSDSPYNKGTPGSTPARTLFSVSQ